ncbi:glycosyltransferase [Patescibacteria group bacterium]|nr:glycosyltransferase [Patescibacteria group bacterium]MCL5091474.1 glycosyltransferase [Patescibacteria group bacterium]
MNQERPFFSVVIPSLNEEDNLPILLQSIVHQTDRDFEATVCDSGSTDATKSKAEAFAGKIPRFRFVEHRCKNVGAARNYGAQLARGEFLVFFDADVEVSPDFLAGIRRHINQHHLDDLTIWNRPKHTNWVGKLILYLLNLNLSLFQHIKPAANGPCIIMRRSLFERLQGFDESIVFGEDFDLIQRAGKLKARFAVFRQPIIYVSTRRFEKEGLLYSLFKSIKALIHMLIIGPIRTPIFHYEMGGQYYKKNQ